MSRNSGMPVMKLVRNQDKSLNLQPVSGGIKTEDISRPTLVKARLPDGTIQTMPEKIPLATLCNRCPTIYRLCSGRDLKNCLDFTITLRNPQQLIGFRIVYDIILNSRRLEVNDTSELNPIPEHLRNEEAPLYTLLLTAEVALILGMETLCTRAEVTIKSMLYTTMPYLDKYKDSWNVSTTDLKHLYEYLRGPKDPYYWIRVEVNQSLALATTRGLIDPLPITKYLGEDQRLLMNHTGLEQLATDGLLHREDSILSSSSSSNGDDYDEEEGIVHVMTLDGSYVKAKVEDGIYVVRDQNDPSKWLPLLIGGYALQPT
ncbi:hypothetical protein LTR64_002300 [Lithohypha guttulata]|uniref:uncharacterized protein n=1 Tax=Lithohypha guttulata TaxID=1690604 RepID=UPI002DE0E6EC|nr:hypothetical protein LTR51_001473 [Lithohypha guttulata]